MDCGRSLRNARPRRAAHRSEEHTSELQSRVDIVCRPLLEKKNLPLPGDLLAADAVVLFLGIVNLRTTLIAAMGRPETLRLARRFVSPQARGILVPASGVRG